MGTFSLLFADVCGYSALSERLDPEDVKEIIASLFGLHANEIADISPEYWRARLKTAVRDLLTALGRIGPTVICIEDLHIRWGSRSTRRLTI